MVENTNGGGKQPPRKSFLYYYGLVMLVVMLLNIFLFPSMMDRTQEVRFDQFSEQLKENNVDEVYVTTNNEIVYTLKNDDKTRPGMSPTKPARFQVSTCMTCWMVRT